MNKIPLLLFVVLAGFFAVLLLQGKDPAEVKSVMVGRKVPVFKLSHSLKKGAFFSSEDLKGTPSIVNVFASWCVTCRLEQGILEGIAKDEDIPVYGLNYKDKRVDLLAWLKKYGNPYTAIGDDTDGRVAIDWGVYGVPETFIVDAEGVIRYRHVGVVTDEVYQDIFKPLLAEIKK